MSALTASDYLSAVAAELPSAAVWVTNDFRDPNNGGTNGLRLAGGSAYGTQPTDDHWAMYFTSLVNLQANQPGPGQIENAYLPTYGADLDCRGVTTKYVNSSLLFNRFGSHTHALASAAFWARQSSDTQPDLFARESSNPLWLARATPEESPRLRAQTYFRFTNSDSSTTNFLSSVGYLSPLALSYTTEWRLYVLTVKSEIVDSVAYMTHHFRVYDEYGYSLVDYAVTTTRNNTIAVQFQILPYYFLLGAISWATSPYSFVGDFFGGWFLPDGEFSSAAIDAMLTVRTYPAYVGSQKVVAARVGATPVSYLHIPTTVNP